LSPETRALALHRLNRARVALREGDLLFEQSAWSGAINRYYYAAFHAARALLATRDVDSARHAGVIALFQQHFVKSGVIPPDAARALPRSFEKRLSSDYGDFIEPNVHEAERVRLEVHTFVETCATVLDREIGEGGHGGS
jgi:uncharacterized protein (UPF0332 family)